MRILGLSAYYHDSAAALVVDGVATAAAQEERFSRKKHDSRFPQHAVRYCLESQGLTLADLDAVIYYEKPLLTFERLLETYLGAAPRGGRSFVAAMQVWLKEKLFLKTELKKQLKAVAESMGSEAELPELLFSEHHLSHAGAAFIPAPLSRPLCCAWMGLVNGPPPRLGWVMAAASSRCGKSTSPIP